MQVCVDVTLSPFGICTVSGRDAGSMSMTGACVTKKWFVTPESNIAQFFRSSTLISFCSNDCATYAYCDLPDVGM